MECAIQNRTTDGKLFLVLMAQNDADMKVIEELRKNLRPLDLNDPHEASLQAPANEHNIILPLGHLLTGRNSMGG